MDDPFAPLTAPPPRYLIESDSSDEDGPLSSSSPRASRETEYEVTLSRVSSHEGSRPLEVEEVIIGLGQAGRYLARKAGLRATKPDTTLQVKGSGKESVMGEGWLRGSDRLLLSLVEGDDYSLIWRVAQTLRNSIKANRWIVVSIYVPSMYIPGSDEVISAEQEAPIRCLDITGSAGSRGGQAKWENPNYVTGIASALASLAAHPATQWSQPLSVLLLPLPLSSIPNSSLTISIEAKTPLFSQHVKEANQKSHSETTWSEADDEPFSAPGMGAGKNRPSAPSTSRADIGTMYM